MGEQGPLAGWNGHSANIYHCDFHACRQRLFDAGFEALKAQNGLASSAPLHSRDMQSRKPQSGMRPSTTSGAGGGRIITQSPGRWGSEPIGHDHMVSCRAICQWGK